MKILIIGGTRFLGRHLVDAALSKGHEVTLFNRGQTNPDLYPGLEHLYGDRTHNLSALRRRQWDSVLDTCGYTLPAVRGTASFFADAAEHYTFISTISVYRYPLAPGADETAPVCILPDGAPIDEMDFDNYGELKVLCEQAVQEFFGDRGLIVRAGLLVGPHDPTDRFAYWIDRIAAGGKVLAPGLPQRQLQLIHARDLSDWIIHMVEARASGTYNATGPHQPLEMGTLLDEIRQTLGVDASLEWVPEAFLMENEVTPWSDLPLWLPESQNSFMEVSIGRALEAGLTFRPLGQTIRETRDWHVCRRVTGNLNAGISRDKEVALLSAWSSLSLSHPTFPGTSI